MLGSVWVLELGSVQGWRLGLVSSLRSGRAMQVSELGLVLGYLLGWVQGFGLVLGMVMDSVSESKLADGIQAIAISANRVQESVEQAGNNPSRQINRRSTGGVQERPSSCTAGRSA